VTLDSETIEQLADAIADRLEARRFEGSRWVSVAVVAAHLSVERSYVYEHATELGARRLGDGPKARLRFRLDLVDQSIPCVTGRESNGAQERMVTPSRRRRQSRRLGTGAPLLPIRGLEHG
jgi:hypothetical protein